ncbi:hypothetical protein ACFQDN_12305 [Pseudomonas asuensis]|jgi:hypothetical protein|uniref:Lipoprotein n=1 Tax=Pseudomonas asuensis TaxID=1825787 RepID=A0ABQ2GPH4_9PSED|nr:hypothetical protein [Pseudomonas asuensis]GGM06775.1 hypothetical protein GCM10009425_17580 [Pseudomonas asuensis]
MRKTMVMLSLALLAACTQGYKGEQAPQDVQIQRYMTEQQLISSMGKPDHVQKEGSLTVLVYKARLLSMSADRSDYSFIFDGGHLVEYTPGRVKVQTHNGTPKITVEPA